MSQTFIPEAFQLPEFLVTDQFCFAVLEPSLAALDYEAVMSSKERLRQVFSEYDDWPEDEMSFEFNKSDLEMHEEEFKAREAFAYAVFSSDKERYIGCVYINPSSLVEYDCEVYLWVRDSELALDEALFNSTHNWLAECWPFKQPVFPGRTINWMDWEF